MKFTQEEREKLLCAKFVGETVINRLEEIGIHSLESLAKAERDDICNMVALSISATCWKNSPQAKKAIDNAIELAKKESAIYP